MLQAFTLTIHQFTSFCTNKTSFSMQYNDFTNKYIIFIYYDYFSKFLFYDDLLANILTFRAIYKLSILQISFP